MKFTFREVQNGAENKKLYWIKNKEKTDRICLIGWGHIVNLVWDEKAQVDLAWGDWLTEFYCVSGQAEYLQRQESYLRFDLLTCHLSRTSSILGLDTCFNTALR